MIELSPGLRFIPDYLDRATQTHLLRDVRLVIEAAPLFQPTMPKTGSPLSVRMTNCGTLGWVSDREGYRYTALHPATGCPWPSMPPLLTKAWRDLAGHSHRPDACLVNFYDANAKMGLHQDRDEDCLEAPVVSLSLGDTAVFRFGGITRKAPTRSVRLASGDALVLGGAARLAFHGIDRIVAGSSTLLPGGGRFNLTLRRVSAAPM